MELDGVPSSGGVFAPTLRFNEGRFYMTTNNNTSRRNFYVYTDDIYGEWSELVEVDLDGIDPSLYFENGRAFFMTNGTADNGEQGVVQCEIDIETGKKLSETVCIWKGSGGRFLESPHLYKINGMYYLMAAEGGTEYGHMITLARADSLWGEYISCPNNPILTNRSKAPFIIQGIGHGDLIRDKFGDLHIVCLGFRQIAKWQAYHNLGRETFLVPAELTEDGWIRAGLDGTCDFEYETKGDFVQEEKRQYTFCDRLEFVYLHHPAAENYELSDSRAILHGTDMTLNDLNPTFLGLRQREFNGEISVKLTLKEGEAGLTAYLNEREHYDIAVVKSERGSVAAARLNIGGISQEIGRVEADGDFTIKIRTTNEYYELMANGVVLARGITKYLSSEVDGGFTGVVLGIYAVNGIAEFSELEYTY